MTRDEVLKHYKVDDGVIRSPGKFEGEPVWAPAFWELALESSHDELTYDDDCPVSHFTVTDDDRAMWPELTEVKTIRLWESDQGFVNTDTDEL